MSAADIPFPPERLASLVTALIPGAVVSGIHERGGTEYTWRDIVSSAYFNAYIVGYPQTLWDHDPMLCVRIRAVLIRGVFKESEERCIRRAQIVREALADHEAQTIVPYMSGSEDGEHFFWALLSSTDVDYRSYGNLMRAVATRNTFEALSLDSW